MSTKYVFSVSPCNAKIVIDHGALPEDQWNDINESECLIFHEGFVDSRDNTKLVFKVEAKAVITLFHAGWDSHAGDTGPADCAGCENTPETQTWKLLSKE